MFDPSGIANWSVTHVDWSERKWHPKSYRAQDVTFELLRNITVWFCFGIFFFFHKMLFALNHSFFLIAILSIECCCFSNCLILFLFAVYWCECSCNEWRGGTQSIPFSNLMLSLKHYWPFIDIQGTSVLSFDFFIFFDWLKSFDSSVRYKRRFEDFTMFT